MLCGVERPLRFRGPGLCWQAAGRGAGGVPAQPVLHPAADSLRALAAARLQGQAAAGAAAHCPAGDLAPSGCCCCLAPHQGLMAAVQAGHRGSRTGQNGPGKHQPLHCPDACLAAVQGLGQRLPWSSLRHGPWPAHPWTQCIRLDSTSSSRVHHMSVRIQVRPGLSSLCAFAQAPLSTASPAHAGSSASRRPISLFNSSPSATSQP